MKAVIKRTLFLKKVFVLLYVGHGNELSRCKSVKAPSWQEALATGKGVEGDLKSERSHQQLRCSDEQKPDIRHISRVTEQWIGKAPKSTVRLICKSGRTRKKSTLSYPERSHNLPQQAMLRATETKGLWEVSRSHSIGIKEQISRRAESKLLRSSKFKIWIMAQQQEIVYQLDLFGEKVTTNYVHCPTRKGVSGAEGIKELQVIEAGEHERALTHNLLEAILSVDNIRQAYRQVKQNKVASGIGGIPTEGIANWEYQRSQTVSSHKRYPRF